MLYSRWLEIAGRQAGRIAVIDGATGETVRFDELRERAEGMPAACGPVIARAGSTGFLLQVLRGWRDHQPVIPVERDASDPPIPTEIPEGVALVKHTPGATGVPRGIYFHPEPLLADANRLANTMDMSPIRPNLAVISPAHSYGFSNLVLPLLLHGVPMHGLPVPYPQMVAAAFDAHETLNIPAVPSIWRAWFRAGLLAKAPIAGAFSAAAPLPLALEREIFDGTGIKLRNFYGASECGGISLDTSDRPRDDPADVGQMLDGVTVSVSPEGRLLIETNAAGSGYDETRIGDVFGEGRFLTHDLGRVDGRRVLLDRCAGGAINVAGRKVSPARVEATLLATGLPTRVRVFGIRSSNPDRVEEIICMVDVPSATDLDALRRAAADSLASWELPRKWWLHPPEDRWSIDLDALRNEATSQSAPPGDEP